MSFFLFIKYIGVTLVNKWIQVTGAQFYMSSVHCIVYSPPQVTSPSIFICPHLPSSTSLAPIPAGHHHAVVSVRLFLFVSLFNPLFYLFLLALPPLLSHEWILGILPPEHIPNPTMWLLSTDMPITAHRDYCMGYCNSLITGLALSYKHSPHYNQRNYV